MNGQGTCSVPQTIAAGNSYICSFNQTFTGVGNYTDIVSATVEDDEDNELTETDDATVSILEVLDVTKTHTPGAIGEPGANVTFFVTVQNTSPNSMTLTTLVDDQFGNLNGQGTCAVPQIVAAGNFYACSFTGTIAGNAGDTKMKRKDGSS